MSEILRQREETERSKGIKERDRDRQKEAEIKTDQRFPELERQRGGLQVRIKKREAPRPVPGPQGGGGAQARPLRAPSVSGFSEQTRVWQLSVPGCVSITLPPCLTLSEAPLGGHRHGCVFVTGCVCVCGLVSPGVSAWVVLVCCWACLCVSHFPVVGGSMFLHDI